LWGLGAYSLLFGALHFDQGLDVAVAVGCLGLLWGILYLKRGSAVMSMTNHASFNAAQVIIARTLGM
jgi:membrane protease YdiL (CAAX protease family)